MYKDDITATAKSAATKYSLLANNPFGYIVSSVLAGIFIGFGVLLIFTISGLLNGLPSVKIIMGAAFSVALSLVVIAGAELFTGNNMVMAVGIKEKTVTVGNAIKLWIVCFIGNWIGAIILSLIFIGTGLGNGATGEAIAAAAAAKMSVAFLPLLLRGVLCNMLVCLAVWCATRCKSEAAKLIMVFWCLFAFNVIGLEHSIANMTTLTIALIKPFEAAVSVGGYFYNIFVVALGNMIGGIICIALPYCIIAKQKKD